MELSLDVSPLNFNTLFPSSVDGYSPTALKTKAPWKKKQNCGREYFRYVVVKNFNTVLLDSLTKWRAAGKIKLSKRLVPFSYKEIWTVVFRGCLTS